MTHAELVNIAESWLLHIVGCSFAFTELGCYGTREIADAIGFRVSYEYSILIECKASRADFLSDKKKSFRQHPEQGLGTFRFYMAPTGIVKPEDLPERWGLITVSPAGNTRKRIGPQGNVWTWGLQYDHWSHKENKHAEWCLMGSALRRLHLRGLLHKIYESPF